MKLSVMLEQLSSGMLRSMEIFFLTLIFSLPLGLLISFGRMSKNKILRTIIKVYISVMRGTPLMLQLLVVYFGPYYLFGMQIGGTHTTVFLIIDPLFLMVALYHVKPNHLFILTDSPVTVNHRK